MSNLAHLFLSSILIGLGATLTFDLWALFLKYVFRMAPSNFCLVGRWILYMPQGILRHPNIGTTPRKNRECTAGWIAHYTIGILFAAVFIALAGEGWLQHPTLWPATGFGMVTTAAPFLILQPAFGLGIAASRTANPLLARLRSLFNHTVFGLGLYLFGWLANWLL